MPEILTGHRKSPLGSAEVYRDPNGAGNFADLTAKPPSYIEHTEKEIGTDEAPETVFKVKVHKVSTPVFSGWYAKK